jgi:Glycosyltransferase 61
MTRAVLNEDEVIAYLNATYDVTVESVIFGSSMWDSMVTVQTADAFIGMHGQAFTNLQWAHPDLTVIQLLPYGADFPAPSDELAKRERIYWDLAELAGARYWRWVNTDPEDAFFLSEEFKYSTKYLDHKEDYPQHPQANVTPPMSRKERGHHQNNFPWVSQNTRVDVASLDVVVRQAFHAAGIGLRGESLGSALDGGLSELDAIRFVGDSRHGNLSGWHSKGQLGLSLYGMSYGNAHSVVLAFTGIAFLIVLIATFPELRYTS